MRQFECCPAIVTHKGAAADAGHYIGFAKQKVFHPNAEDVGDDWYKFDDDKVSPFPVERLATLDGGGESNQWSQEIGMLELMNL
jgi:ubiquitin carboxyl-terminal hydrolase 14